MEVFIVGGAVRDGLLGKVPKDIDYVVVGATPDEMLAAGFSQVGADFPVFLHPETGDEYALARTERKVGEGYHGFAVTADPSTTLADDLSRRDLTINAMAQAADGSIVDPFNGQQDLLDGVLRHVSPAFAEDPLRVIRLARFYARYKSFRIANETWALCSEVVERGDLNSLPHERFWAELAKVFEEDEQLGFFEVIKMTNADEHVKFFHELYGHLHMTTKLSKLGHVAVVASKMFESAQDRLMHHTALTAEPGSKTILTAQVRTQNLYNNVHRVRHMAPVTVEGVYEILQRAKLWSQSPDFSDLIDAMHIMQETGELLHLSPQMWGQIAHATSFVTAERYMDKFQGKALGEAIKQGRMAEIEKIIGNRHDV